MVDLTGRFEEALVYAFRLHAEQRRKVGSVPYISHLLSVTSLVLEDGGDEDEAIAALLHDAVEDQGGLPVLAEIRERFGERVARIVDGCTDAYGNPKPPWRERKQQYLEKLHNSAQDVHRVSLADKLHNARMIVSALKHNGASIWDRFKGGREGTLWYYDELLDYFKKSTSGYMVDELESCVTEINQLAARTEPF